MKKTNKCCYGISSVTQDYRHIFMADCDNKDKLKEFREWLDGLQIIHDLSDIYLIKSTHGYNAISLDKLSINSVYNFGMASNLIDTHFLKYGFRRNYFVIRFDKDKKLIEIMKNNNSKYEKSQPHAWFLNLIFGLEIETNNSNFDDNTIIDIIQYPSDKNGYHKIKVDINAKRQRQI